MKIKKLKRLTKSILAIALVLSMLGVPSFADEMDDVRDLEKINQELEEQISEHEARLEEIQANVGTLEEHITSLNKEIEIIEGIIEDYENQKAEKRTVIAALEETIAQLEADIAVKEEEIADQYELMKKRIKFLYENVEDSYFEAILAAENFSVAFEKIQYLLEITRYDRRMMDKIRGMVEDIKGDKKEVENQVAAVERQIEQIQALEDAQAAQRGLIEEARAIKEKELEEKWSAMAEAQDIIDTINQEIQNNLAEIESIIEAYEARLAAEEEARRKKALEESGFYDPDTAFIWPLPGNYRTVTSWFGSRYDPDVLATGAGTWHAGIDFYAPVGTPIYAVLNGVVVLNHWGNGIGWCVALYHGNGLYTEVHHMCAESPLSMGQEVAQGDIIGYVGATGWYCTGPHLHFAVACGHITNFVNPAPYLGL
ncbi:MAG: murein hydrolase activator EnvC family protein [Lachnospiraceae bacterium]|jgi:murein DD-endopeptidase MepM/ murein hydrolase activator NlpD